MKVSRLLAIGTGRLYSQQIFLVIISVRVWVYPRAMVGPAGLSQWKKPTDHNGNGTRDLPACSAVLQCLN